MLTDPKDDYERGFVPFLGTTIFLDSKPLIPRTETEWWVEKVIKEIPEDAEVRVLDMFSGSGCIGVAVLKNRPHITVTFGEFEKKHLPTIRKNIEENEASSDHTHVVQTDVWSNIEGVFDYIFANPPYISKGRGTVSADALENEPHEALFAEDDGFYFIQKIIQGLPQFLAEGGVCFIEHEPYHSQRICDAAEEMGLYTTTHKDQYGILRYSRLTVA